MTTTRLSDVRPTARERLPWPSLLVLGAATLVMVTAEMLPTAVLTPMSLGLGVPESTTAQLVSLWAATVVVASFPLVRLARGRDRRTVIAIGMVVLGASSALIAAAPTFLAAVAGRLVGALAVGLLWATVNAHVADLVSERLLGAAVAVVLGGATLGMVIGTPLARLVADLAGWRVAFLALAAVGVAVGVLVRTVVARPDTGDRETADAPLRAASGRSSFAPTLVVTSLVALALVGHYGAYTFVTRLAEGTAAELPGGMTALLLAFGVASGLGVAVAGRAGRRTGAALAIAAALTAASLLALVVVDVGAGVGFAVVTLWGFVSGALPPLAQTEILRLAGRTHRTTAGALIPVLFNGGIAVGAALAALLVARFGLPALPVPASVVAGAAAIGLAACAACWPPRISR